MLPDKVKAGEPITPDPTNGLIDELRRVARLRGSYPIQVFDGPHGLVIGIAKGTGFDLVELIDTIEARQTGKTAKRLSFDATSGTLWPESGDVLANTADAMDSLYLAGERHLVFFHPAAGQRIPLPGVQFHLGILAADLESGGTATVEVWTGGSSPADSTHSVTARDWVLPAGITLANGSPVLLLQHPQSKAWYVAFAIPPPALGSLRFTDRAYDAGETLVFGDGDAAGDVTILPVDGTIQVGSAGLYFVEFDASAWYADSLPTAQLLPPLPQIATWQLYNNGSSVGVDGATRFTVPYLYYPYLDSGAIKFNPILDGGNPVPQPACGSFALSITLAANDILTMKYDSGPTVWLDHVHFRVRKVGSV